MWIPEKGRKIVVKIPKKWHGIVPSEVFLESAKDIAEEARKQGVVLRTMGGVAVRFHCLNFLNYSRQLGRLGVGAQEFSDLDFVGFRRQYEEIEEILERMDYRKRVRTLATARSGRDIYYHPKGWFYVDVFFDRLTVANHQLNLKARLELDFPTITVADLLLEKLQIWERFGVKDLKDVLLLLRAHNVGESEEETINAEYVAKLLAKDWGFWYTATTNLKRIKRLVENIEEFGPKVDIIPDVVTEEDRSDTIAKITTILKYVDREEKTLAWRTRSLIGTGKKWYKPIETKETIGEFGIWTGIRAE